MNYSERLFRMRHGFECEPATLAAASLAISAAGTAMEVSAQNQAASAQRTQQASLTDANNYVAGEQITALRSQQAQSQESTARENEKARLAAQRGQASARVSAGEAGVSGNSVDALLSEYDAQLGQFREATNRQTQLNAQGVNSQIESIRTGTRFQNLQINAPVSGANYGAAAVRLAGGALSTYKAYNPDAFNKPGTTRK